MAELKIKIPAPCDYDAELAKNEKECVVINAYENKEKELNSNELGDK